MKMVKERKYKKEHKRQMGHRKNVLSFRKREAGQSEKNISRHSGWNFSKFDKIF